MTPAEVGDPNAPKKRHCTTCQREFDPSVISCTDDGTTLRPTVQEELVGTVFVDRYEILSIVGEGGMGTVYKARHKLMRRLVAIKLVHPHLVYSAGTLSRFQQESEAVSSLNHPNIVTVYDFGLAPRAYLVMDYLDGVSLGNLLENRSCLDMERSLRIFLQISAGLAHAHEKGVIHRDLKPGNIMMITADGQPDFVKIVDFGIAKLMLRDITESRHLTATGEIFGSPLFMSPEQCQGKSMDARSDIYSLGCIMYRTLTGHQPILGKELMECLYNHVNTLPKSFGETCPDLNLPGPLEEIVMKCMEKTTEKRFQSMLQLKSALESVAHTGAATKLAPVENRSSNAAGPVAKDRRTASEVEAGFAAHAAEQSRASSVAEAGRAAFAVEEGLAASAAEAGRAAGAAESARVRSAAETSRAAIAAESGRAANAAEVGRAALAAEAGRAASVHESGLAASAAESVRIASAAEAERAASATRPGDEASAAEISLSASAAELERRASAAETSRAASAAEAARAASVTEAGLAARANEAACVASALEASLVASAHEATLAASAHESGLAASAVEAERAASAAESGRAASAAEVWRAATAAEVGRAASAAEAGRAASAAEAGKAASAAESVHSSPTDNKKQPGSAAS